MRRLFWMGLGAVGAVVVVQRARSAVKRLPDTVAEAVTAQVGQAGQRASSALHEAVDVFRAARAERETELVTALLVEPEGGTERRPRTARAEPPASRGDRGDEVWDDDPWGPADDED
ncbi:hypothetical protein [Actinotalea fermentans]|uniref:Uncharacterized protein n=1 Tax=Actinotalea fermentans TaxID=43671 RepID=A0A511YUH2_9CELL|nr:hypothetical protein [Actinotalea fermentans]KGM15908.1 hypothetical protein N867_04625 [Actinotalea fermentans ATCC 43279 = JCM 9966 = DSM 3133]GEN78840.1 hypothetical protein AFE02nite_05740 [Actinotalea fermentans]